MGQILEENWLLLALSFIILSQWIVMIWLSCVLREARKHIYEVTLAWHKALKRLQEQADEYR